MEIDDIIECLQREKEKTRHSQIRYDWIPIEEMFPPPADTNIIVTIEAEQKIFDYESCKQISATTASLNTTSAYCDSSQKITDIGFSQIHEMYFYYNDLTFYDYFFEKSGFTGENISFDKNNLEQIADCVEMSARGTKPESVKRTYFRLKAWFPTVWIPYGYKGCDICKYCMEHDDYFECSNKKSRHGGKKYHAVYTDCGEWESEQCTE